MSTVLYLANQQIEVVTGTGGQKKIEVTHAYSADAPEGSIINGIIMEPEAFVAFLKDFWQKNQLPKKDVTLMINSTKFAGKLMEMPKLNPGKTLTFIQREFTNIRREEDEIYGYITVSGGARTTNRIYAQSVSAEYIGSYLEIFREVGISIAKIYSAESSLINLAGVTTENRFQTFALMVADHSTLTSVLWVDGGFYHFQSTRSFHEQGSEEYAMDVARCVSQIMQFMQAHQVGSSLEAVRLAGFRELDVELYRHALELQGIRVPLSSFDSAFLSASVPDVQKYLNAVSGLVVGGNQQNYLVQYRAYRKKNAKGRKLPKGAIAVAVIFFVMAFSTLGLYVCNTLRQQELSQIDGALRDVELVSKVAEYDGLNASVNSISSEYAYLSEVDENIYSYPVCDDAIVTQIKDCAGDYAAVDFESFDADQGIVEMSAMAENVDDINKFIKLLSRQDIFNDVDYTGYSYNEQSSLWDIHVTCTLVESAGR